VSVREKDREGERRRERERRGTLGQQVQHVTIIHTMCAWDTNRGIQGTTDNRVRCHTGRPVFHRYNGTDFGADYKNTTWRVAQNNICAQPLRLRQLRVLPVPCSGLAINGIPMRAFSPDAGRVQEAAEAEARVPRAQHATEPQGGGGGGDGAAGAAGAEVSRQASCFPAYAAAQVDRGMWKGIAWDEGGKLHSVPVRYRSASALKSGSWQARNPAGSPVSCTSPFRV
jgi:hypothetical protein